MSNLIETLKKLNGADRIIVSCFNSVDVGVNTNFEMKNVKFNIEHDNSIKLSGDKIDRFEETFISIDMDKITDVEFFDYKPKRMGIITENSVITIEYN
jgi:peroxiredoxin